MFKLSKFILVWVVILSTMSVTYGYAASNTNLASVAGASVSQISGYVVSNLKYRFASDPTNLKAVELDLDQSAVTVMIKLVAVDSQFHPCVNTGGYHWLCNVGLVNISTVDELSVIASSN